MRRGFFLILSFLCIFAGYGQSGFEMHMDKEGKIFILPKKKDYRLDIPKISYETYTPHSTFDLDKQLREIDANYVPTHIDERPMDMQVLSDAYKPFYNVFAPMIRRVSPTAFDFDETSITRLSENWFFVINGRQHTWPGMGGLATINPAMVWNKGRLTLSGGGFAGTFYTPFNQSSEYLVGANVHVRYDATDWLALRSWGQFVYFDKDERYNPHMILNPAFNHTGIGAAAEVKFNENFGVGVGVNYEYNHWNQRLERQMLFYPVFKSKSGFQIRMH